MRRRKKILNFSVRREKILNFRGLQTENIDFWRSGRRPGELREGPRRRFPSVLVVLRRFWEVFGGSERVWNGFRRFSEGFRRFLEDFRRVRGGSATRRPGRFQPPKVSRFSG